MKTIWAQVQWVILPDWLVVPSTFCGMISFKRGIIGIQFFSTKAWFIKSPLAPLSRRIWVSTICSPSVFLYLRGKERCIYWAFTLATSTEEIFSNLDVGTGRLAKSPPVPSGSGKWIVLLRRVLGQEIGP